MQPPVGHLLALAAALASLAGCGHDGRLVVVVDSDIPTLTDIAIRTARLAGGGVDTRDVHLGGAVHVPFSFAVVPNGHPQDGVEIVVEGATCSTCAPIVSRRVQTGFVHDSTRLVRMFLSASCASGLAPSCGASQSCDRGACVDVYVPPDRLAILARPGDELDAGPEASIHDAGTEDAGAMEDGGLDAPESIDVGVAQDAAADDTGLDAPIELDAGVDAPEPTDVGVDAPGPIDAGTDAYVRSCDELYGAHSDDQCGESLCMHHAGTCCEFYTRQVCGTVCQAITGSATSDDQWSRSGGAPSCTHGSIQSSTDSDVICRCPRVP